MNRSRYESSEIDLSVQSLEKELARVEKNLDFRRKLNSTTFSLIIFIAIAVIISVTMFPVLRIFGSSMEPTLIEGDIVVSQKTSNVKAGELIAFYYGNKVLVKRCIAISGDTVFIDENGEVFVNENRLYEPYIINMSKGESDIEFPYEVPNDRIFVMGDDRENSIDSRSTQIGCVACEQIIGKINVRIWPLGRIRVFR